MTKRALKLPDGGTVDLPIPEGFGLADLAAADAAALDKKHTLLVVGIALGFAGILLSAAGIIVRWKAK